MRPLVGLVLLASAVVADEGLIELTRDSDRGVRYAAVQALGEAGVGIPAIIRALDDPEWCVRQCAGHALVRVGKAAIPALKQVRRTGKVAARVEAVEALRRLDVADEVLAALDDEAPEVRFEALMGLWLLAQAVPGAKEKIEPYLADDSLRWRIVAYLALAHADPGSRPRIRSHLDDIRSWCMKHTWEARWTERLAFIVEEPSPKPEVELDAQLMREDGAHDDDLFAALQVGEDGGHQHHALHALLENENARTVHAAYLALDWTGVDAKKVALENLRFDLALSLGPLTPDDALQLHGGVEAELSEAEKQGLILLIGRLGKHARTLDEVIDWSPEFDPEPLRATVVWTMGRLGHDVSRFLGDRSLVVRHVAAPFVSDRAFLRRAARSSDREARLLALHRLGELDDRAPLRAAARDADPLVRIAAVRALGRHAPLALASDPERDVRIALAQEIALESLLRDANWRVRLASIESFGRAGHGAAAVAPFLTDSNLALSAAAAKALAGMGAAAAWPVAQQMLPGNEASWHYAPEIFEALGADGAAAVPLLVRALRHPNMVAREAAARCLGAVGPGARAAAPALIDSLDDRWLGVVSHAAMALGRIGAVDEARGAYHHANARVRAYAAFAVGWTAAARRGLDQAPYERRFPVLDCGEKGTGLRSRRAWVASLAVAPQRYDTMSPWESERAFEILIGDGFRPGHVFDFDAVRGMLGSNELPALLEFLRYPAFLAPDRYSVFANLHRSPRAENIPAILWFGRNEDALRSAEISDLYQPFWKTERYRKELTRFWLGREGDVWDVVRETGELYQNWGWWMNSEPLDEERERLLASFVLHRDPDGNDAARRIALRQLGRGRSTVGEAVLRWVNDTTGLARRGDPTALAALARTARDDVDALADLVEFFPRLGAAVLRAQLSDTTRAGPTAELVYEVLHSEAARRGTRWTIDPFLGLASAVPHGLLDCETLGALVRCVPGYRTERIARHILERPEAPWMPGADAIEGDELLSFLLQTDRRAVLRKVRAGAASQDEEARFDAQTALAWIGEESDAARIEEDVWRDMSTSWSGEPLPAFTLRALAEQVDRDVDPIRWAKLRTGVPVWVDWDELREDEADAILDAVEHGMAARALKVLERQLYFGDERYWMEHLPAWALVETRRRYKARRHTDHNLGLLMLRGEPGTRAVFWSAMRAGRYRWVVSGERMHWLTMGDGLYTLPHWREELESNCCRISGTLASTFEDGFGVGDLYRSEDEGVGQPPVERVLDWFRMYGGDWEWSPLEGRFRPRPE